MTEQEVRDRLLGAWRLLMIETIAPDGTITRSMGDHPVGQISYDPSGRMAALLSHADRPVFASENAQQATDAEVSAAWRTYAAYFGPFTIDADAGTVTHHIEGAWFPNFVGTDQVRHYSFEDDRLILQAPTPAGRARVTWQRF